MKQWMIETPDRVTSEKAKFKKANMDVKVTLDAQVKALNLQRQQSREDDISMGATMVSQDLKKSTYEAQVQQFKKHEMSKQLREAWSKQALFKENQRKVEKIF